MSHSRITCYHVRLLYFKGKQHYDVITVFFPGRRLLPACYLVAPFIVELSAGDGLESCNQEPWHSSKCVRNLLVLSEYFSGWISSVSAIVGSSAQHHFIANDS